MWETEGQTSYVLLAVDAKFLLASKGVCTSAGDVIQGDHMGRSYMCLFHFLIVIFCCLFICLSR